MADYVVRDTQLVSVADAIRAKGGTSAPLAFPDGFVDAVDAIPTGGGGVSVPAKEVNFRDYDGTIVYSYTPAEFAALTAMPDNPDHSGDDIPLTSQGWNWSLTDAQAYVAKYGRLEVGQMYIATDEKTHVVINIPDDGSESRLNADLRFNQSNTTYIDWGDGTAKERHTGTQMMLAHNYTHGGVYDISIEPVIGEIGLDNNSSYSIYGKTELENAYQRARVIKVVFGKNASDETIRLRGYSIFQCYRVETIVLSKSVEVGTYTGYTFSTNYALKGVTVPIQSVGIGDYAFRYCYALKHIALPKGLTSIGSYALSNCQALKCVTIPEGITMIQRYCFQACRTLEHVVIPDTVTSILTYAFTECVSLQNLTIPSSVTSIASYAFNNCKGVKAYHMQPTTPPTLSSTTAFYGIPSDCIIYVPYSADHSILNAYKTATNWSTYASHMQEEPQ